MNSPPTAPGGTPWLRMLRAATASLALQTAGLAMAAVVAEEAGAGSADTLIRARTAEACLAQFADAYRLIGPAAYALLVRCDASAQGWTGDVQAPARTPRY